jgi:hypothetical protein
MRHGHRLTNTAIETIVTKALKQSYTKDPYSWYEWEHHRARFAARSLVYRLRKLGYSIERVR